MDNLYIERDQKVVWHPFTPLVGSSSPLMVNSAKGAELYTADGRTIIDAISSWWVNLHGHSNPDIAAAVSKQASTLEHVIFAGFTHEPAIRLAELLLKILPDNQSKIFYSDNGSTAVEVALKMAFQYWYNKGVEKNKVIAIEGAYHGDTFGAMSVGDRGAFTAPFSPFLFDVEFLEFPTQLNEARVLEHFMKIIDGGDVAAFIFEPLIQGSSGMRMYSTALLEKMILYANEKQVLCIADEVMTGFGRTGKNFAVDHLNQKPDIICLSKGLTGGTMAMGVTSCTEDIIGAYQSSDIMKTFFHGHSFTANPLACAAAIASMELLMTDECRENIKRINYQHELFKAKIEYNPKVKDIRCLGTILAMEIATESDTSYFNEARHRLYPYFIKRNILLRPLGNVIYVLPPYVITDQQLAQVYSAIEELIYDEN
jgi:adenosylmethionine---8-amino-7-oxononanoate aminotransferase